MSRIQMIRGRPFNREQVEMVERWLDFSLAVLAADEHGSVRRNYLRLRTALTRLAERAQAQYPQLQSGESLDVGVGHLRGSLDAFPRDVREGFIALTQPILADTLDGPLVCAEAMTAQLHKAANLIARRRGQDAID